MHENPTQPLPVTPPPCAAPPPEPPQRQNRWAIWAGVMSALVLVLVVVAAVLLISSRTTHTVTHVQTPVTHVVQKNTVTVQRPATTTTTIVPAPTTTTTYGVVATPPLYAVDQNISATIGISGGLANNVFYDYWNNGGSGSETYMSWSPATGKYYNVVASSDGVTVTALVYDTTGIPGQPYVTFPQWAVDAYTQAQADRYLASGNHG